MTATFDAPARSDQGSDWHSLHVWLAGSREDTDQLLVEIVAPLADELVVGGGARRWFYLRYSEGGHHLRLRLGGAAAAAVADLAEQLATRSGLDVTTETYRAEHDRYGGPQLMDTAEEVFCVSTQVALAALRPVPAGARRMAAGVDLILATAAALGLDGVTTVAWLRNNACTWRWHRDDLGVDSAALYNAALQAAVSRREAIGARWQAVQQSDAGPGVAATWGRAVRGAAEQAGPQLSRARALGVWSSQLHMLLNRLGVTPDEERWLEWLVAAALEQPGPSHDFFSGDLLAADRAYLSASRYVLPEMPQRAPADAQPPEPLFDWTPFRDREVDLPGAPVAGVTLQAALAGRRSGRGPYGPMAAAGLGTMLWNATTPEGAAGLAGRAYPSAGGQYPVRLRVVARDVAGLAPGLYEADPARHRLARVCDEPSSKDLAATSMWFADGEPEANHIDTRAVPAVIGLYVDLGAIRARYGLRALRFSLLEAGHVAQNLALLAAATGHELCPLGGFYDDVAHDVFLLDGTDRVLTYLLPVGGAPPAR